MRNKKQEKILSMIDGYDSIETLSTSMSAIFLVWLLPAAAGLLTAFFGFSAGTDADSITTYRRLVTTVQVAEGVLGLFTVAMFVYWVFRARENVRRLGKRHKIGLGRIFLRHVVALAVGFIGLLAAIFIPPIATLGVVVFVLSILWFSLMFTMMAHASVRMLWRTSSAPTGSEDELPSLALLWIVTWVLSGWTGGALQQQPGSDVDVAVATSAVGLAIHSFTIGIAAVAIALLIRQIAARQESRLAVIISHVDVDVAGSNGAVTTNQINDAWDASGGLVDFNR